MQNASEPPASPTIFNTPRKRSAIAALSLRAKGSHGRERADVAGDERVDAAPPTVMAPSSSEAVRLEADERVHDARPVQDPLVTTIVAVTTTSNDAALLSILDAPHLTDEPASIGFARKERALRDAFAELTILAARALERRLANPTNGDRLAEQFGRLIPERKHRLLQFLADARRRAAVSGKR
ncbi:MAG: hypothetical protein H0T65_25240 [Deltaproteobacteria bacterium]|nr:hypothetical protein [Deltaproteobacteria bacterium]